MKLVFKNAMKLVCRILVVFIVLLLSNLRFALGQDDNWVEIKPRGCNLPLKERKKIHIQEVSIKDTVLIDQLKQFAQQEAKKDFTLIKGLWYLYVIINSDNKEDVAQSYYINRSMISLKKDSFYPKKQNINVDPSYPPFYAYVEGRLVFIHNYALEDAICYRYSKKSKHKLRKLQEPFLEKTRKEKVGLVRLLVDTTSPWVCQNLYKNRGKGECLFIVLMD
jgi:hypothetical protein